MKPLPGLNDLRVFEAAARLQNFRQAAEELHLTPGAVSHRIRALEDQLGVPLFDRMNGVRLTDAGRDFHEASAAALTLLRTAVDRLAQSQRGARERLRVAALPGFVLNWLLPRLPAFRATHPEVSLEIETSADLVDLARDGVDLAIRLGRGHWPGLVADKLFDDYYYPVATPEFLARHGPLSLQNLAELPLIDHAGLKGGASWPDYFRAAGLPHTPPLQLTVFHESQLALNAAERGLGLALARHSSAHTGVAEGRLLRLFDLSLTSEYAYYLVSLPTHQGLPRLQKLKTWLLSEASDFVAASSEVEDSARKR